MNADRAVITQRSAMVQPTLDSLPRVPEPHPLDAPAPAATTVPLKPPPADDDKLFSDLYIRTTWFDAAIALSQIDKVTKKILPQKKKTKILAGQSATRTAHAPAFRKPFGNIVSVCLCAGVGARLAMRWVSVAPLCCWPFHSVPIQPLGGSTTTQLASNS